MSESEHLDTIRKYYDGCNRGDIDQMMSTFTPDVVHYFLNTSWLRGAAELANYWTKFQNKDRVTVWTVDHGIAEGDEAVIEWTMKSTFRDGRAPRIERGAEWYVFRNGKIAEIRAYYHQFEDHHISELESFPYAQRGYPMLP